MILNALPDASRPMWISFPKQQFRGIRVAFHVLSGMHHVVRRKYRLRPVFCISMSHKHRVSIDAVIVIEARLLGAAFRSDHKVDKRL